MIENEIGKLVVYALGGKWPARKNLGVFASLRETKTRFES